MGISESTITSLLDPRGNHAFARALLLAGLELPCDAARLQPESSTKRGERRGGIASGPAVDAGLLLVGVRGCAQCRVLAHVCRGLPRPTWASPPGHMPRTSVCYSVVEKSSLKKPWFILLSQNTSFCMTWGVFYSSRPCDESSGRADARDGLQRCDHHQQY